MEIISDNPTNTGNLMPTNIQFNMDQALQKLGELVAKHGPQAVDLAAQVVQVNAVGAIAQAVASVAIAGLSGWATMKLWRLAKQSMAADKKATDAWIRDHTGALSMPSDNGWLWCIPATAATGAAVVFTINGVAGLFDTWAWVALFEPKLALAHQVLAKFAGL